MDIKVTGVTRGEYYHEVWPFATLVAIFLFFSFYHYFSIKHLNFTQIHSPALMLSRENIDLDKYQFLKVITFNHIIMDSISPFFIFIFLYISLFLKSLEDYLWFHSSIWNGKFFIPIMLILLLLIHFLSIHTLDRLCAAQVAIFILFVKSWLLCHALRFFVHFISIWFCCWFQ